MRISRWRHLAWFAAVTLTACASADPTYYTLMAVPGPVLAGGPATIEVRRPGLAGYLDRSDIVLKSADYRLAVNSQLRWGEPLGDMVGRVLAQDLTQRLPGSSVYSESGAITADPSVRVEVDVQDFEAVAGGPVILNAEVAVEQGSSHRPLAARHVSLSADPAGPGAANLVATMSALLGQLADQLSGTIRSATAAPARG
jgi:uncharacterized lipoprotein YmbA